MWSKGDTRYLKIFFRQHFHPLLKGDYSHQPKPPARLHHLLGQVRLGLQPPNQTSNFGQIFLLSSFFAMRTGSLMACSAFSGSSMGTLCMDRASAFSGSSMGTLCIDRASCCQASSPWGHLRKTHFKFYKILCLLGSVCIIKRRFSNYRSILMVNVAY